MGGTAHVLRGTREYRPGHGSSRQASPVAGIGSSTSGKVATLPPFGLSAGRLARVRVSGGWRRMGSPRKRLLRGGRLHIVGIVPRKVVVRWWLPRREWVLPESRLLIPHLRLTALSTPDRGPTPEGSVAPQGRIPTPGTAPGFVQEAERLFRNKSRAE
jgi:hypothetical protein